MPRAVVRASFVVRFADCRGNGVHSVVMPISDHAIQFLVLAAGGGVGAVVIGVALVRAVRALRAWAGRRGRRQV